MIRGVLFILAIAAAPLAAAASDDALIAPAYRLQPDDPAWQKLLGQFTHRGAVFSGFEERRFFPFKKTPTTLTGEVRVSPEHGLSLHYTKPDERIVIFDAQGLLVREVAGAQAPPPDPRTTAAQQALSHILSFDFRALAADFELYGQQEGDAWTLAFVPRDESLKRALGRIVVAGVGEALRRIELRHSARQYVEIALGAPQRTEAFSADELRRFFR